MNTEIYKLTIGFLGFNREQTINNFKSFIKYNERVIKQSDLIHYTADLIDGTHIQCVFKGIPCHDKLDQIILSDDNRFNVRFTLLDFDFNLSNQIPEDYQIIYDNIDSF